MTGLSFIFSPRDDLPDALFAMLGTSLQTKLTADLFPSLGQGAVLGFANEHLELDYTAPSLVILPKVKTAELFSWLKTYAAETYPLSQFGRVVSLDDFKSIEGLKNVGNVFWKRPDRWASVVLGEILAQSDADPAVSVLPLSRANATFSFAVAKSAVTHRDDSVTDECIHRLKILSADRRFVERSVSLNDLDPIWRKLSFKWDASLGLQQLIPLMTDSLSNELFESPELVARKSSFAELLSDSVEQRVLAFRKFSNNQISNHSLSGNNGVSYQDLALAAFLVGRGTSHVFLLKDIARQYPAVYGWFGLIAGLAGPTYWDIAWARAAKGIEKTLKSNFSWAEPSSCDISWPEYSWIASTENEKLIAEIPKQLPKVLSIEVFPGATCQLRLKSARAAEESVDAASPKFVAAASFPESDLVYAFVREFIKVSDKAKLDLNVFPEREAIVEPPKTQAKKTKRVSTRQIK